MVLSSSENNMNRQRIFDRLQTTFDDASFSLIQREEYIQIFAEVMESIGLECECNLKYSVETITVAGDTHVFSQPQGMVYKLEYLKRNDAECREISLQSILTAKNNLLKGYNVNDTELSNQHYALKMIGTDLTAYFALPLEINETLESLLLVSEVDITTVYTDVLDIPGYMADVVYYGIYSRILETLYTKGKNKQADLISAIDMKYDRLKRNLKSYIKNLKTTSSFPQIQSFKWLSED